MADGRDADAFVIVHHPEDGSEPYGIGPFPDLPGLSDTILAKTDCPCRKQVLWVAFPPGIAMAVGVDMDEVVRMAGEMLFGAPADHLN